MTAAIESPFIRDPSRGAEAVEEERLGCLLCVNSRATYADTWCEAAKVNGGPVTYVRFPFAGHRCPMFLRRPE